MLKTAIVTPVLVIGSVTFALSLGGVYIGQAFGHFFEKKIEIFGGLVLIGIGSRSDPTPAGRLSGPPRRSSLT